MRLDPHNGMLPELAFRSMGGRLLTLEGGGKGSSPPAPDYGPMREASDHAADLGKELGDSQLAEAKRQYDLTMKTAEPVVKAQLGLMDQAKAQGDDYYEYGKRGRGVEDSLNAESMIDRTGRDAAERDAITGTNAEIEAGKYGEDIRQQAGTAGADARAGTTQQMQQLIRQGLRYGYSPSAMAAKFGSAAISAGLGEASAVNAARSGAISNARGLMTTGRNMRIQDDATGWGKKMDVAGLYRNMPGASAGSYGLAMGAGNSAVGNTAAPGTGLMAGMAQGAGMTQTGMGQKMTGYAGILNSQTSSYNAGVAADAQGSGLMGSLVGAAGTVGAAMI